MAQRPTEGPEAYRGPEAGGALEAYGLQGSPLCVVEVAREHAVTWLLGELGEEVRQVGLQHKSHHRLIMTITTQDQTHTFTL